MTSETARPIQRVRFETRRRTLSVLGVTALAPNMVQITLGGDLEGFKSFSFDDHIKIFLPSGHSDQPAIARDFTPADFNHAAGTLDIEVAIHEAGPAANWARAAHLGQSLEIGGPRGSMIIATTFLDHVLIGDGTALPAIKRRLRELPAGARALAIVEIPDASEEQPLSSQAEFSVIWVHRGAREAGRESGLADALRAAQIPNTDVFAWAACEADVAKALRQILIDEKRIAKTHVKASGYWRRGAIAVHEKFED